MRAGDTEDEGGRYRGKRRSQTVAGFMLILIGAAAMFVGVPGTTHTVQMIGGIVVVGLGGAMIDKVVTLDYIERLTPLAGRGEEDA